MNPVNINGDTVVQGITIKSSAEKVFAALSNPDEVVKWWGVEGRFQVTQMESDLRPGAKWRMHVQGSPAYSPAHEST
jgi:uncharacterized protein YndB with AHSA1/START domain